MRVRAFRCVAAVIALGVIAAPHGFATQDDTPRPKLRPRGRLPAWATESWVLRRQFESPWALVGGTIIDVDSGERRTGSIVIRGDEILRITDETLDSGMHTVDVEGAFLIPGLFDLHAHVIPQSPFAPTAKDPKDALRSLLAAGVTTIRDLPLYSEMALRQAAEVSAGRLQGPTIVAASALFEKERQRSTQGFGEPNTAARWVAREALAGARWVKVYNSMDEASLRSIVGTARAHGMRVCGHTEEVPPLAAARLGIATIEHAISIPLSCFGDETPEAATGLASRMTTRWAAVDDARAGALVDELIALGTAWVPTLVVSEALLRTGVHDGVADGEAAAVRAAADATLRRAAKLAVAMHRRGGLVGTGSDFPVDGVEPGTSLHRELELLVEFGGATPLEALRIATRDSARILGFGGLLGTVQPGALADLVILGADPLEDIGAVRDVQSVVHLGRVLD